jgi:hypothetical protein
MREALRAAILALALTACARENPYADVTSIAEAPAYQNAALLEQAWALPVAAAYRDDGYEYQSNPSFCGPTSAANLLQSRGEDVTQQSVLKNTDVRPIFGLLPLGLTLDEEAELLRDRGQRVTLLRDLSLDQFREHLARANDPASRYIINFHRGPLWGEGHGHFSPILGYLAEQDLVFVGDVNETFQPFLVSSERLFQAMDTIDSTSKQKRGLLLVETPAH